MKTISIADFLSESQVDECAQLYPDAQAIRRQVIEPNLKRINEKLGQENDPTYLSYMVVEIIRMFLQRNTN